MRALESFEPTGRVLELACGTGVWTEQLIRHARSITAIDAAPEMLALARARIKDERVRFLAADIFSWEPDGRYDVVAFAFWLSHVPPARFERFWELLAACLRPGGRVFFIDDAYRTPAEPLEGEWGSTVRRRLNDARFTASSRSRTHQPGSSGRLRSSAGGCGSRRPLAPSSAA